MSSDHIDVLKEALDYDPTTGEFRWKIYRNSHGGKVKPGAIAGTLRTDGYRVISFTPSKEVGRLSIRAHRLAFLFMGGKLPEPSQDVDHINGRPDDNSWLNLRLATRSQNIANNHKASRLNTSGVRGVSLHKASGKWLAKITIGGQVKYLGLFVDMDDAVQARKNAEIQHHGNFARRR